ncbi:MAG: alpha-amylase family glycosyl hydrolase [Oscillospiraceae bacterium]|nr:alpha-amylase family glycosyl hydrolase [Oscillospiraceae bacterium]
MSYWFENAVIYHIYPLGYCGCPKDNPYLEKPGKPAGESPILKVLEHIPTIKKLGFNALYIGPVFESTRHGYDTADFLKIDSRLGTNADFARVCKELHKNGIRVILDAVFNHVGRDFFAFKDLRQNRGGGKYAGWFHTRGGNSNYNDGFFYEGWEGHYELVKLNLQNPEVKNHLKEAVTTWYKEYGIDGLRLDVAYSLDLGFLRELRSHCKSLEPDFWLMGETLHGDYNVWMNPEMCDSVTNYQCYKGLYSSFNDLNMFEIAHSFNDHFMNKYRGKKLYCFVDNHDVGRIASVLKNPAHLLPLYALMFTMPGIPGVYYGSEYGFKAAKSQGDDALRPEFSLKTVKDTELTRAIAKLAHAHAGLKPLWDGDYRQVVLNNQYFAFARSAGGETVYTLINASAAPVGFNLGGAGNYADVLTGEVFNISREVKVAACSAMILAVTDAPVKVSAPIQKVAKTPEPAKVSAPVQEVPKTPAPAKVSEPAKTAPVLIARGKTKDVFDLGDGTFLFKFKDNATVNDDGQFDPGGNTVGLTIGGLGEANLKLTKHLFEKINAAGYPTHFVSANLEKAEMTVRPAVVFGKDGKGLEAVCRFRATGSFIRRYGQYAKEGDALNGLVEITLKDDQRGDPPITQDTLVTLGILTNDEYRILSELTKGISHLLKFIFAEKGLDLYDLKLEFGKVDGKIVLIDEIAGGSMRVYRDGKGLTPFELTEIITR